MKRHYSLTPADFAVMADFDAAKDHAALRPLEVLSNACPNVFRFSGWATSPNSQDFLISVFDSEFYDVTGTLRRHLPDFGRVFVTWKYKGRQMQSFEALDLYFGGMIIAYMKLADKEGGIES